MTMCSVQGYRTRRPHSGTGLAKKEWRRERELNGRKLPLSENSLWSNLEPPSLVSQTVSPVSLQQLGVHHTKPCISVCMGHIELDTISLIRVLLLSSVRLWWHDSLYLISEVHEWLLTVYRLESANGDVVHLRTCMFGRNPRIKAPLECRGSRG